MISSHYITCLWTVIPCGSIMTGQRLELDTMIPLSVLKLSTGNPAICQARTLTASPRIALRENTLEHGIFFAMHFLCQSFIQSFTQKNRDERTFARKWEQTQKISSVSAVGAVSFILFYFYFIFTLFLVYSLFEDNPTTSCSAVSLYNAVACMWRECRSKKG